jgi:hypothetical protein
LSSLLLSFDELEVLSSSLAALFEATAASSVFSVLASAEEDDDASLLPLATSSLLVELDAVSSLLPSPRSPLAASAEDDDDASLLSPALLLVELDEESDSSRLVVSLMPLLSPLGVSLLSPLVVSLLLLSSFVVLAPASAPELDSSTSLELDTSGDGAGAVTEDCINVGLGVCKVCELECELPE